MRPLYGLILFGCFLLAGCADFASAIHALNDLHMSGCHEVQIVGAAGYGGGISGTARGIVATGDATLAECRAWFNGTRP